MSLDSISILSAMFMPASLCSLDFDQPLGFRVLFAGCLLGNHALFLDVAKVLPDLDEPNLLVSRKVGADHLCVSALTVVALAVPAVEGEADALPGLEEMRLEILAGNAGVVVVKLHQVSHRVCVCHCRILRFRGVFPFGTVYITLNGDNSKHYLRYISQ